MSADEPEQLQLTQRQEESRARVRRMAADAVAQKHLRTRFTCTPETMPPELHKIIARWLYTIVRVHGADRDHRTTETIRTIGLMTDWHQYDIERAMRVVAGHLSPSEAPHS